MENLLKYNKAYKQSWVYGVSNGFISKVSFKLNKWYQLENENYLINMERYCVKELLNASEFNYPNIIFKLYQVNNFEKTDKFYYVLNGQIINYQNELIQVEVSRINKVFTLFNPEDLEKIKTMFGNDGLKVSIIKNEKEGVKI